MPGGVQRILVKAVRVKRNSPYSLNHLTLER